MDMMAQAAKMMKQRKGGGQKGQPPEQDLETRVDDLEERLSAIEQQLSQGQGQGGQQPQAAPQA